MGVLVTGVGYIGSKLIEDLVTGGDQVVGLDNLSSTPQAAIERLRQKTSFTFISGSILDPRSVREALKALDSIDCVYHLAAQASAHPRAATPRYTETTNLLGSRVVFEKAVEEGASRIVFGSSLRVYGPFLEGCVSESSPYGVFQDLSHLSKCYVEKLLELTAHQAGISATSVRLGVVYGVSPVMKSDYRHLAAPHKFCLQAVRGETIEIHPWAKGQMGFIHVADASHALRVAARAFSGETYVEVNAATEIGSVTRLAALVAELSRVRGIRVAVEGLEVSEETEVSLASRLDQTSFAPQWTLSTGLAEVIDYFSRQEEMER